MMLYDERAELILQQLQLQSTKRMQSRSIPGRRPVSRIIWRKYDRKKDVSDRAHPFFCSFYYLILILSVFVCCAAAEPACLYDSRIRIRRQQTRRVRDGGSHKPSVRVVDVCRGYDDSAADTDDF